MKNMNISGIDLVIVIAYELFDCCNGANQRNAATRYNALFDGRTR